MVWTRNKKIAAAMAAVVAVAGLVVGLIFALGGRTTHANEAASTPSASPSPSGPLRSPFTGEIVSSLKPVLAVKIDNIVLARPSTGLTHADIIYALPVEGGLSRLMAIFSSHVPQVVGPVRSAREDDMELLRQFGRPAFAYSGATPTLLPFIHRHARIVNLYAGTTAGYYRDFNRVAPYNLYAHARQLVAEAHGASLARDIGFWFGPPPPGGKATRSRSVSYPAASFGFTWSKAKGRWLVSMDGTPAATTDGGRLSAATVVIQYTTMRTSVFKEYGFRPPYAESVGSGRAVVLRDGKAWNVRWSRPKGSAGTTFTTASGQPMTFATGQVWVILAYK
jgi:Protein of unknown function (DUF3048) N-terminal domain/Protein of unknown function (DUF3048) C-terminal domain